MKRKLLIIPMSLLLLAPAARALEPAEILAKVKAASGGAAWDGVRSLHVRAQISASGLSGTGESWEDARTGRFLETYKLGPYAGANGFDGKTSWSQDASGQTVADDSGDGREGSANEAYRRSLSYFYPDRRPAAVRLDGERTEDGRTFQVISIHPEGGRPFEMWIDSASWLIGRLVEKTSQDVRTTFYSEYRTVDGLSFPFAQRITNGETKYDQVITFEAVEVNPALDEARFRMPEGRTEDFAIAGGKASAVLPFRLLNNHIYIEARVNGQGPLTVLFDTAGANVLTPDAVSRLGLETQGKIQGRGAGEKSEDVALAQVRELRLGDATLKDQMFYVFPLAGLDEAEGMDVDGIVGFEVLERLIAQVDYAGGRLTFFLPAAFPELKAGTAVPFTFAEQAPQVDGEVDGMAGKFTIDTGSRSSLTLNGPFAEKHGLAARYGARVEALTGWGVGGGVRSTLVRPRVLKLGLDGGVEVPAPTAEIALTKKGAFANPHLAGNVGGGVLKRFTVTFDYSRQRIILEPNANFAKPDTYDRAGLWLNGGSEGFTVMDVVSGGPAAEAGLRMGDAILAVDGRSAKEILLPDLRARLRESPPGTALRLTVRSGAETREVRVVLRDLV